MESGRSLVVCEIALAPLNIHKVDCSRRNVVVYDCFAFLRINALTVAIGRKFGAFCGKTDFSGLDLGFNFFVHQRAPFGLRGKDGVGQPGLIRGKPVLAHQLGNGDEFLPPRKVFMRFGIKFNHFFTLFFLSIHSRTSVSVRASTRFLRH